MNEANEHVHRITARVHEGEEYVCQGCGARLQVAPARLAAPDTAAVPHRRFGLAVCTACGGDFYPQFEDQMTCIRCPESQATPDTAAEAGEWRARIERGIAWVEGIACWDWDSAVALADLLNAHRDEINALTARVTEAEQRNPALGYGYYHQDGCSLSQGDGESTLMLYRTDELQVEVNRERRRAEQAEQERDDYKLRFNSYYALEARVTKLRQALRRIGELAGQHDFDRHMDVVAIRDIVAESLRDDEA